MFLKIVWPNRSRILFHISIERIISRRTSRSREWCRGGASGQRRGHVEDVRVLGVQRLRARGEARIQQADRPLLRQGPGKPTFGPVRAISLSETVLLSYCHTFVQQKMNP